MPDGTCTVPGCQKPLRSGKAKWCAMHYHRWYRHGSVELVATAAEISVSHGRRYRTRYLPHHPLASKHGIVYVHRAVLYDEIGPGPHPCHWCQDPVDWLPKGQPGAMQVDHLDGVGDNNDPANLVQSCGPCNTARGSQARAEALRSAGWWSRNDTIAALRSGGRRPKVA